MPRKGPADAAATATSRPLLNRTARRAQCGWDERGAVSVLDRRHLSSARATFPDSHPPTPTVINAALFWVPAIGVLTNPLRVPTVSLALQLDGEGRFSGDTHTMALCGYVRGVGEGDDSINRLTQEAGMLHKVFQA